MVLTTGSPHTKPATSTRFVLPFAYCPAVSDGRMAPRGRSFRLIERKDIEHIRSRQDYFTRETAAVLYDRARWAELHGDDWDCKFNVPGVLCDITVRVDRPRLILFEWPLRESPDDPCATCDDSSCAPDAKGPHAAGHILQTGFLVLDFYFPDPGVVTLSDLLRLNDLLRYWQQPYPMHFGRNKDHPDRPDRFCGFLGRCPVNFLDPGRTVSAAEPPDAYFERWASLLELPFDDGSRRWRLIPGDWTAAARRWCGDGERSADDSDGWIGAYPDSRAFVWAGVIAPGGGNDLRTGQAMPRSAASRLPGWIKLLNVDPPGSDATAFEQRWAAERTYGRWEEGGTFYGFNYHAGAMLAPPLQPSSDPSEDGPPLWRIFRTLYFDQTLLLLYLRVTTFRFSRALSELSRPERLDVRDNLEQFREGFTDLRWEFSRFTNLYEFPLLSSQQQGIEMYELARRNMDVEALFREVQDEIKSSHDYLEMRLQAERTETAARLTEATTRLSVVATFGLALSVVAGLFGMNIMDALVGREWKLGALTKGVAWVWFIGGITLFFVLAIAAAQFGDRLGRVLGIRSPGSGVRASSSAPRRSRAERGDGRSSPRR